jgi:ubiquitin-like protein Nedd8
MSDKEESDDERTAAELFTVVKRLEMLALHKKMCAMKDSVTELAEELSALQVADAAGAGAGAGDQIRVFVKKPSGPSIRIDGISIYNTVRDLKDRVFDAEGTAPRAQRILFNGKRLIDGTTLRTCGITESAVVHMVLALRGGMFDVSSGRAGLEKISGECVPKAILQIQRMIRDVENDLAFLRRAMDDYEREKTPSTPAAPPVASPASTLPKRLRDDGVPEASTLPAHKRRRAAHA